MAKTPIQARQLANLPANNLMINGGFDFAQRGATLTNVTSAKQYGLDRWIFFTNGSSPAPSLSVTQTTDAPQGLRHSVRLQRTAGNTNDTGGFLIQGAETLNCIPLQGKSVVFSFYAKAGANYSAASSAFLGQIYSGTGIDENPAATYTGQVQLASNTVNLTTSWQRFYMTGVVPSNATEIKVLFRANHVGTAGADDSVYVSGVMVHEGLTVDSFRRAGNNIAEELAMCQRYYEKSYSINTIPQTNTSEGLAKCMAVSTTLGYNIDAQFNVRKRTNPFVQIFSRTGTSNTLTNESNTSNSTVTVSAPSGGDRDMQGFTLVGATDTVVYRFHFTVDAEL